MRNPCRWPVVLVLAFSSARAAGEEPRGGLDFSAEALSRRFQALQPDIEEALGEKLEGPIEITPATREDVASVIAAENLEMLSELEGGPRGVALVELCRDQARAFSAAAFAKLDAEKNRLLIVGENFGPQAAAGGAAYAKVLSPEFLDLILIHESIHLYQNRKFGLMKLFGKPRSQEELLARMSVCEGHAQFITRKIVEKRNLTEVFDLHERVMSEVPPSVDDPALRLILETVRQFTAFPYVEGRRFFTAVAKDLGHEKALARVFGQPPGTLRTVSNPDEYLSPSKTQIDLKKLAEKGAGFLDGKKYRVQVVMAPESALRQGCMLAGKDAVDRAFKEYKSVAIGVGASATGVQGAHLLFTLIELESEAGAKTFLELEDLVSRKKDERFKEPGGLVQIVSVKYEGAGEESPGGIYADKRLKIMGLEEEQNVRSLVIGHKRFVIEVTAVYTPETKEDLQALAKKLVILLDEALAPPAREAEGKTEKGKEE